VQGGVYLLYLHSFAFKYRYILYMDVEAGAASCSEAACMMHHSFVPVQWLQQLMFTVGKHLHQ
jgi:hypothetical protein